jgi:hypothetical protein
LLVSGEPGRGDFQVVLAHDQLRRVIVSGLIGLYLSG